MNSTSSSLSTRSANASDVGLIVQGLLIFLSAVVGVIGYIVQSKMKAKIQEHEQELTHQAHLKQLKLKRVREQLGTFLGPASMHTMQIWHQYWIMRLDSSIFNKLSNNELQKYWENEAKFNFRTFLKAEVNELTSWIGPSLEDKCRSEPKSSFAIHYRNFMTRLIKNNAVPLSKLLKNYGGHLQHWPTSEEFKKRFVCVAENGWGRNLFFLQFSSWTDEFVDIIDNMWSKGDYTLMFPLIAPYPCQITPYIIQMISKMREMEVTLGTSDRRDVISLDKETKKLEQAEDEAEKKLAKKESAPKPTNKKYLVNNETNYSKKNKEGSNDSSTSIDVEN